MKNSILFRLLWIFTFYLTAHNALAQEPLFRIGILSDVQYCNAETRGSRNYNLSVDKLQEAVSTLQNEKADFFIHLGDFIDHDFNSYAPLLRITQNTSVPFYQVLGNHDFSVDESLKKKVPTTMNMPRRYYSFTKENWRILCIDGTDRSIFSHKKDTKETRTAEQMLAKMKEQNKPNATEWNGAVGEKQLRWIQQQLTIAEQKGENVLVCCHYPIFPANEMENLWNADELRAVLEKFQGKLVYFNGHTHKSKQFCNNGINYVFFRGMVEGTQNSFAIAEVFNDSIRIKGFAAEKDFQLNWKK